MDIGLLTDAATDAQWHDYVMGNPQASNYHQTGWKAVIEQGFGHQTQYFLAKENNKIVGILPLVLMKSRLFGRFAVSLPFFNYGGILADDCVAEKTLLASAQSLAIESQVSHLELRHRAPHGLGLRHRSHKVSMILELVSDVEAQWKGFDPKVRNQIRKAEKSGLRVQIGGRELLDDFYTVFARNMRDLGTPVYGRSFFQAILKNFPSATKIVVVKLKERPVAAGMTSAFKKTVEMPWASSLRDYRSLCPNMLLYWETIAFAIKQGAETFDFGRSTPGEGTYKFKEQWGAQPVTLAWEYWTASAGTLPDISPKNPKYERAIQLWKRLPVAAANWLGPSIVRNIP